MLYLKKLILLMIILIFPSALMAQEAGEITSKNPKMIKIVAFGDSLMAGYQIDYYMAFPAVLERKLHAKKINAQVYNAGKSGDTSFGGLERIDTVLKQRPDIVLLELGINDIIQGKNINSIYHNLVRIVTILQKKGVKIILIGGKLNSNYNPEIIKKFEGMYGYLAKKYNLALYPDFLKGVTGMKTLTIHDGFHPNSNGVKVMVKNFMPEIEKMLHVFSR